MNKTIYVTYRHNRFPLKKVFGRWQQLNEGWQIDFSDDRGCAAFIKRHFGNDYYQLFADITSGTNKAHLWRLCKLYVHGGLYADIDLIPYVGIDKIVADADFCTSLSVNKNYIFNAFIFARQPRNPILKACITSLLSQHDQIEWTGNQPSYDMYRIIRSMCDCDLIANTTFDVELMSIDNTVFRFEDEPNTESSVRIRLLEEYHTTNHWQDCKIRYDGVTLLKSRDMDYQYAKRRGQIWSDVSLGDAVGEQTPCYQKKRDIPKVVVAILAKQAEAFLPFYFRCLLAQDYPKEQIILYINTNNNTDNTVKLLREFVDAYGHLYQKVELVVHQSLLQIEQYEKHEWNDDRFIVMGQVRQESVSFAAAEGADYYFVADVDNFLTPTTLSSLVGLDLPVVGPLVWDITDKGNLHNNSNYFFKSDPLGYYISLPEYFNLLNRDVTGIVRVDVIHCVYLIRSDVFSEVVYFDGDVRHEFLVFSDYLRARGITQYLDNRMVYGCRTMSDSSAFIEDYMAQQFRFNP